jgi:hypothetical protein
MHAHKIAVGFSLIVTHFGIIILVSAFWILGGFLFTEMVTAIGMIVPLFAGYTTIIFSYINEHRKVAPPREPVAAPYRFTPFLWYLCSRPWWRGQLSYGRTRRLSRSFGNSKL